MQFVKLLLAQGEKMIDNIDTMSPKDLIKLKAAIEVKLSCDEEIKLNEMYKTIEFRECVKLYNLLSNKAYKDLNYSVDYCEGIKMSISFRFLDVGDINFKGLKDNFIGYIQAALILNNPKSKLERYLNRFKDDLDADDGIDSYVLPQKYWHNEMFEFKEALEKFIGLVKHLEKNYSHLGVCILDEIDDFYRSGKKRRARY